MEALGPVEIPRIFNQQSLFRSQYNKKVRELDADLHNSPHLCLCLGLCKKWSVHRHVCVVFSPEQPIVMFSLNHCVISRLGN
jgi:hypothetical protein